MIDAQILDAVLARVTPPVAVAYDVLAQQLRGEFSGLHITVCGEDDIPPRLPPAAENAACYLYYVNSSEHCLALTTDAEVATGIVVALRGDD